MADVDPSSEDTTKSMYNLSVIIRFANSQGNKQSAAQINEKVVLVVCGHN